jgi:PAS domain S-box-containing protein
VEFEMMADTKLKKMEEAPSLQDKDYRTLLENVPVLIVRYDTELRRIYVNPAWEKVIGLSSADVLNKRVDEIPELPAVANQVEKMQEVLKSGTPQKIEFSWAKARDKTIFVEFVIMPEYDRHGEMISLLAVGVDQTGRREAEEQLRNSERNLRTTIETIPAFVFSALPDGSMDFASRSWFDYSGLSPEEVFGWDWTAVVHPEDRDRALENWHESLATGEPRENEHRVRQANGEYRWFLARNSALRDEKGQIVRWYVVLVDIENQKRTEARLLEALDEIKKLQNQLSKENIVLREEIDRTSMFEEIVGASPSLKAVLARIDKVAPTDSIVFITGETGTGKELVARAIHKRSPRASRAFVSVNCAAIPAPLIASELFGHEKGAFTGAHQRRLGRFELAEGGTIFLDEIGELPMETQIALLRVLQDQQFERLGSHKPIQANARVITATNRDLKSAIAAGSFRRDLFYRLNVFPIEIPPLRERKEDIPILVEYFIHRYASKLGKKIRSAGRKTLDLLQSYSWPGNIRELQNVVERSIIVCDTEQFSVDERWLGRESCQAQPAGQPLSDMLVIQTKEMIEAALAESGGRVSGPSGAAAKLGMPASTLESKIKSLKINKYLFKKSI